MDFRKSINEPRSRKRFCSSFTTAVLLGASWWMVSRWLNSPLRTQATYAAALASRDWGAIYDLAPQKQVEGIISRKQYVLLLDGIAENLPEDAFTGKTVTEMKDPIREAEGTRHFFVITLPHAPLNNGLEPELPFPALHGPKGWVVALNTLPTQLSAMAGQSEERKWQIFAAAMDTANLERYPFSLDRKCVDRTNLKMYLKGDLPLASVIHKPRPGS
jgi:hypothetical protein